MERIKNDNERLGDGPILFKQTFEKLGYPSEDDGISYTLPFTSEEEKIRLTNEVFDELAKEYPFYDYNNQYYIDGGDKVWYFHAREENGNMLRWTCDESIKS